MPPRQAACNRVATVPELQLFEIFFGAGFRQPPRDSVKPGLVHDDGERRLEHVEIDFLRHHADAGFGHFQLSVDVVAEYLDHAAGFIDQGGCDANQGGLAGAVWAQQREEIALVDVEIYRLERLDAVFVDLGELAENEGMHRSRVD